MPSSRLSLTRLSGHSHKLPLFLGLIGLDAALTNRRNAHILSYKETYFMPRTRLVGEQASTADVACYPCIAPAPAGRINPQPYHHVTRWLTQMEALPGFVPMYTSAATA